VLLAFLVFSGALDGQSLKTSSYTTKVTDTIWTCEADGDCECKCKDGREFKAEDFEYSSCSSNSGEAKDDLNNECNGWCDDVCKEHGSKRGEAENPGRSKVQCTNTSTQCGSTASPSPS